MPPILCEERAETNQAICTMLLYQDVLYNVLPICVGPTYLQVPTATNWKTDRSPALCDEHCVGSSINTVIYYILQYKSIETWEI